MNPLLNSEQNPEWSAATDDAQRTESRANKKLLLLLQTKIINDKL